MERFDEQVWKVAVELSVNERHFNQLQHQYRLLASSWTLALFAGLQFLLSQWGELPIAAEVLLLVLGLAGAVGISLLWNLDLRVYQQLLDACFVEGLRLEQAHDWLPQLRTRMLATQDPRSGVLGRSVWFYLGANTAALSLAVTGAVLCAGGPLGGSENMQMLTLVLTLPLAVLWGHLLRRGARSPALERWAVEERSLHAQGGIVANP